MSHRWIMLPQIRPPCQPTEDVLSFVFPTVPPLSTLQLNRGCCYNDSTCAVRSPSMYCCFDIDENPVGAGFNLLPADRNIYTAPLVFTREPETLENAVALPFSVGYRMLSSVRAEQVQPNFRSGRFSFFFRAFLMPFSIGTIFSENIFKPTVFSFAVHAVFHPEAGAPGNHLSLLYSEATDDGPSLRDMAFNVPSLTFNNTFQTFCLSVDLTSANPYARLIVNGQDEDDIQFNTGLPGFDIEGVCHNMLYLLVYYLQCLPRF